MCFSKYVTFHIAIKTVYGVNVTTENIGASWRIINNSPSVIDDVSCHWNDDDAR